MFLPWSASSWFLCWLACWRLSLGRSPSLALGWRRRCHDYWQGWLSTWRTSPPSRRWWWWRWWSQDNIWGKFIMYSCWRWQCFPKRRWSRGWRDHLCQIKLKIFSLLSKGFGSKILDEAKSLEIVGYWQISLDCWLIPETIVLLLKKDLKLLTGSPESISSSDMSEIGGGSSLLNLGSTLHKSWKRFIILLQSLPCTVSILYNGLMSV